LAGLQLPPEELRFQGVPIRLFAKVDSPTHERTIHHCGNIGNMLELFGGYQRRSFLSRVRKNSTVAARR